MNEREELEALRRLAELERRQRDGDRRELAADYGLDPKNPLSGFLGGARHAWDRAAYGLGTLVPDVLPQGARDAINGSTVARATGLTVPGNDEMYARVTRGRAFVQEAGVPGMLGDLAADAAISAVPASRATSALTRGATALSRVLPASAAANAGIGFLTSPDDRVAGAVGNAAGSVVGEVGGRVLTKTLGGLVSSAVTPEARKVMDEGAFVPLWKAADGRSGRVLRNAVERAKALPVAGDIIRGQERAGIESWNQILARGASPPVPVLDDASRVLRWESQPVDAIGHEGLRELGRRFDDAYGALYGTRGVPVDRSFLGELDHVVGTTRAYTPGVAPEVEGVVRKVRDTLAGMTDPTVTRTGGEAVGGGRVTSRMRSPVQSTEQLGHEVTTHGNVKKALDTLEDAISSAWRKGDAEKAEALGAVRAAVEGLRARGLPPEVAAEARAINSAYADFKTLQRAASSLGAQRAGGVVTPAQQLNAIKARDRSVDKRAFAAGTARGQQQALDANAVFGSHLPEVGPGTAEKLLPFVAGGLPMLGADAGASLLLGTRTGQNFLMGNLPWQGAVRAGGDQYLTPALRQLGAAIGERRADEVAARRDARPLGMSEEQARVLVAEALAKGR